MPIDVSRIYVIIVVFPIPRPRIVGWIDINAIHFSCIKVFQQLKRMIVVGLDQRMPKVAVRGIADSVDWFQIRIDWLPKFGNRDKVIDREFYRLCLTALYANSFSIFDLQNLIEITDISCLESSLNSTADRNIVKRRTFRKMFFKNKAKLLLLGLSRRSGSVICLMRSFIAAIIASSLYYSKQCFTRGIYKSDMRRIQFSYSRPVLPSKRQQGPGSP